VNKTSKSDVGGGADGVELIGITSSATNEDRPHVHDKVVVMPAVERYRGLVSVDPRGRRASPSTGDTERELGGTNSKHKSRQSAATRRDSMHTEIAH